MTPSALPSHGPGPVFQAPWEAQAFAMTVNLHARGHFTWSEWTNALAAEIAAAQARGEPDDGSRYYEHWLAALEKLLAYKGLILDEERLPRKHAWEEAAHATPHGQPLVLQHRHGGA